MHTKQTLTIILTLTLLTCLNTPTTNATTQTGTNPLNDDWPMFHHDTAFTGATTSSAPKTSPKVLWSTDGQGLCALSPAIADGIVYASSQNLCAYNASTGENLWTVTNGGQECSPIVSNGIVYTGAYCGTAYNASTGSVIWSMGYKGLVSDTIAVSDGYFYTVNKEGFVQAHNAATGAVIWTSETKGYSYYWAISNGYIYFGIQNIFHALDEYNGSEVWQFRFTTEHHYVKSNPSVSLGYVYFGSNDGNLYCLDAFTGKLVWNYKTGAEVHSSPAVAYGCVYVGSQDRNVYALNATTGEKVWNYTTDAGFYGVNSSPAIADGVVYVGADDAKIYALDAYTGAKLWSYKVDSEFGDFDNRVSFPFTPAIAYGNIYIVGKDHFITALSTNDQNTNDENASPWSVILIPILSIAVLIAGLFVLRRVYKNRIRHP
jgi:outer membrane protein assembly factor BamB